MAHKLSKTVIAEGSSMKGNCVSCEIGVDYGQGRLSCAGSERTGAAAESAEQFAPAEPTERPDDEPAVND